MADTTDASAAIGTSGTFVSTDASPTFIDDATFHADVAHLESLWRRIPVGALDLPIIDVGEGAPIVFVPILEHLEFVYARQVRCPSRSHRVILYRRREERWRFVGLEERAEELRSVLDALGLQQVDLVGHGDAAMVLFEFAARYPQRCRSLVPHRPGRRLPDRASPVYLAAARTLSTPAQSNTSYQPGSCAVSSSIT